MPTNTQIESLPANNINALPDSSADINLRTGISDNIRETPKSRKWLLARQHNADEKCEWFVWDTSVYTTNEDGSLLRVAGSTVSMSDDSHNGSTSSIRYIPSEGLSQSSSQFSANSSTKCFGRDVLPQEKTAKSRCDDIGLNQDFGTDGFTTYTLTQRVIANEREVVNGKICILGKPKRATVSSAFPSPIDSQHQSPNRQASNRLDFDFDTAVNLAGKRYVVQSKVYQVNPKDLTFLESAGPKELSQFYKHRRPLAYTSQRETSKVESNGAFIATHGVDEVIGRADMHIPQRDGQLRKGVSQWKLCAPLSTDSINEPCAECVDQKLLDQMLEACHGSSSERDQYTYRLYPYPDGEVRSKAKSIYQRIAQQSMKGSSEIEAKFLARGRHSSHSSVGKRVSSRSPLSILSLPSAEQNIEGLRRRSSSSGAINPPAPSVKGVQKRKSVFVTKASTPDNRQNIVKSCPPDSATSNLLEDTSNKDTLLQAVNNFKENSDVGVKKAYNTSATLLGILKHGMQACNDENVRKSNDVCKNHDEQVEKNSVSKLRDKFSSRTPDIPMDNKKTKVQVQRSAMIERLATILKDKIVPFNAISPEMTKTSPKTDRDREDKHVGLQDSGTIKIPTTKAIAPTANTIQQTQTDSSINNLRSILASSIKMHVAKEDKTPSSVKNINSNMPLQNKEATNMKSDANTKETSLDIGSVKAILEANLQKKLIPKDQDTFTGNEKNESNTKEKCSNTKSSLPLSRSHIFDRSPSQMYNNYDHMPSLPHRSVSQSSLLSNEKNVARKVDKSLSILSIYQPSSFATLTGDHNMKPPPFGCKHILDKSLERKQKMNAKNAAGNIQNQKNTVSSVQHQIGVEFRKREQQSLDSTKKTNSHVMNTTKLLESIKATDYHQNKSKVLDITEFEDTVKKMAAKYESIIEKIQAEPPPIKGEASQQWRPRTQPTNSDAESFLCELKEAFQAYQSTCLMKSNNEASMHALKTEFKQSGSGLSVMSAMRSTSEASTIPEFGSTYALFVPSSSVDVIPLNINMQNQCEAQIYSQNTSSNEYSTIKHKGKILRSGISSMKMVLGRQFKQEPLLYPNVTLYYSMKYYAPTPIPDFPCIPTEMLSDVVLVQHSKAAVRKEVIVSHALTSLPIPHTVLCAVLETADKSKFVCKAKPDISHIGNDSRELLSNDVVLNAYFYLMSEVLHPSIMKVSSDGQFVNIKKQAYKHKTAGGYMLPDDDYNASQQQGNSGDSEGSHSHIGGHPEIPGYYIDGDDRGNDDDPQSPPSSSHIPKDKLLIMKTKEGQTGYGKVKKEKEDYPSWYNEESAFRKEWYNEVTPWMFNESSPRESLVNLAGDTTSLVKVDTDRRISGDPLGKIVEGIRRSILKSRVSDSKSSRKVDDKETTMVQSEPSLRTDTLSKVAFESIESNPIIDNLVADQGQETPVSSPSSIPTESADQTVVTDQSETISTTPDTQRSTTPALSESVEEITASSMDEAPRQDYYCYCPDAPMMFPDQGYATYAFSGDTTGCGGCMCAIDSQPAQYSTHPDGSNDKKAEKSGGGKKTNGQEGKEKFSREKPSDGRGDPGWCACGAGGNNEVDDYYNPTIPTDEQGGPLGQFYAPPYVFVPTSGYYFVPPWMTSDMTEDDGKQGADRLVTCSYCKKDYDIDSLDPPLSEVPSQPWICPSCLRKIKKKYSNLLGEHDPPLKRFSNFNDLSGVSKDDPRFKDIPTSFLGESWFYDYTSKLGDDTATPATEETTTSTGLSTPEVSGLFAENFAQISDPFNGEYPVLSHLLKILGDDGYLDEGAGDGAGGGAGDWMEGESLSMLPPTSLGPSTTADDGSTADKTTDSRSSSPWLNIPREPVIVNSKGSFEIEHHYVSRQGDGQDEYAHLSEIDDTFARNFGDDATQVPSVPGVYHCPEYSGYPHKMYYHPPDPSPPDSKKDPSTDWKSPGPAVVVNEAPRHSCSDHPMRDKVGRQIKPVKSAPATQTPPNRRNCKTQFDAIPCMDARHWKIDYEIPECICDDLPPEDGRRTVCTQFNTTEAGPLLQPRKACNEPHNGTNLMPLDLKAAAGLTGKPLEYKQDKLEPPHISVPPNAPNTESGKEEVQKEDRSKPKSKSPNNNQTTEQEKKNADSKPKSTSDSPKEKERSPSKKKEPASGQRPRDSSLSPDKKEEKKKTHKSKSRSKSRSKSADKSDSKEKSSSEKKKRSSTNPGAKEKSSASNNKSKSHDKSKNSGAKEKSSSSNGKSKSHDKTKSHGNKTKHRSKSPGK